MTLNEKYCDLLNNDEGFDNQLLADRCEFMAEKFAIGFAKWLALNHTEEVFYEDNYTEEMLEKYKKDYENKTV